MGTQTLQGSTKAGRTRCHSNPKLCPRMQIGGVMKGKVVTHRVRGFILPQSFTFSDLYWSKARVARARADAQEGADSAAASVADRINKDKASAVQLPIDDQDM